MIELIIFILCILLLVYVVTHLGDIWQILDSLMQKAKNAAANIDKGFLPVLQLKEHKTAA